MSGVPEELLCRDIMSSPPVTASPFETVGEGARIMTEKGVGSLVIVDDKDSLLGIVTKTDFVKKVVAKDLSPREVTLGDIMTRNPYYVFDNSPVLEAAEIMGTYGIGHLPVLDHETYKVVGVVSMREDSAPLHGEGLHDEEAGRDRVVYSLPGPPQTPRWRSMVFEGLTLRPLSEAMGKAVVMDKDYSLSAVLEAIDKAKTDRAVLTEKKKIRGIVTLRDVIFKLGTVRTKQTTPSAMHASSFMSEPVKYLGPEDTVLKAATLMVENKFTSVPVVDGEQVPQGIFSRWEMARLLAESSEAADASVRDYMRTPPVSVTLQTRILHVRQLLFQHDLSVIPVIEDGELVGVIGIDEVALVFIKYYELARGEPKRITPLKFVIVADAIRLRPPKVTPDASLAEAAQKILDYRYRAVVVEDKGKPVGIISGHELAKALIS